MLKTHEFVKTIRMQVLMEDIASITDIITIVRRVQIAIPEHSLDQIATRMFLIRIWNIGHGSKISESTTPIKEVNINMVGKPKAPPGVPQENSANYDPPKWPGVAWPAMYASRRKSRKNVQALPPEQKKALLIIVHPGSACGSASFNLGNQSADAERRYLAQDIAAWKGPVAVIDGSLSDELCEYSVLDKAIRSALAQGKQHGIATRLWGCDDLAPHQADAAAEIMRKFNLHPEEWKIELTGAWHDPEDKSGCVNGVRDVFKKYGFATHIRDSAIDMRDDDPWDSNDDLDENHIRRLAGIPLRG